MVLGSVLTQFVNRNGISQTASSKRVPQFNSVLFPLNGPARNVRTSLVSPKKTYMAEYINRIPELTGLTNMVAGDIVEDSYFEPVNINDTGRNKIMRAKQFMLDINLRRQDFSTVVDMIVTGEGYGWMAPLLKKQVDKAVDKRVKELGLPNTGFVKRMLLKANFSDEDLVRPTKYRYMASSTVENVYDHEKITGFIQKVGTTEVPFTPEEIIHYLFYDIDGRVEGFTPVRTMMLHLELLRFMWKNSQAMAKNGGQPDRLYSVEDMDISSPAYKRIQQELKKYHDVNNRHGSLLLNGKITVQDLVQLDTMQFQEMGLYITGLIAMQWRIPRSRIPYINKDANTKDDTGGNSEKSYYHNIEFFQDLYMTEQNKQLWIPHFGVKRKFKKAYKHDELVEEQTKQTRLNNLTFLSNELGRIKKQLTPEYMIRYVNGINENVSDEDIKDIPKEELMMQDNSQMRQSVQSNDDSKDSQDKKNSNQKKKNEKLRSEATRGEPTGLGKETFSLKKHLELKERQKVSFATFIKLYNEDKSFNMNPPRVFVSEREGIMRFTYKSTDFVYESMTPASEVSRITLMNFIQVHRVEEDEILDALEVEDDS